MQPFLQRLATAVRGCLNDCPAHADRVLLAGGGARLRGLLEHVRGLLAPTPVSLAPDCVYAGMICIPSESVVLSEVLLEVNDSLMHCVVPRRSPVPCSRSAFFLCSTDFFQKSSGLLQPTSSQSKVEEVRLTVRARALVEKDAYRRAHFRCEFVATPLSDGREHHLLIVSQPWGHTLKCKHVLADGGHRHLLVVLRPRHVPVVNQTGSFVAPALFFRTGVFT